MLHENLNGFILSGGPGSGKTTVLGELEKLGFPHVPEVARQIIREQMASGGSALPWQDREAYTRIMLRHSVQSYLQHAKSQQPLFFDRGIPDTFAYARLIGIEESGELMAEIRSACQQYRYAGLVLVAPPWREIYETDAERKQDFREAERTFEHIIEVYRECGYQLCLLPKLRPAERAQFILGQLQGLLAQREDSANRWFSCC